MKPVKGTYAAVPSIKKAMNNLTLPALTAVPTTAKAEDLNRIISVTTANVTTIYVCAQTAENTYAWKAITMA